jgi:hypothetical protein
MMAYGPSFFVISFKGKEAGVKDFWSIGSNVNVVHSALVPSSYDCAALAEAKSMSTGSLLESVNLEKTT